MKINTTPGETYIVLSTGGCTVTTGAGKQIKKLAAGQDFFTAMTGDSIISDDNASVSVAKGEILAMLNTDGTGEDVQDTLRFQPVTSQSALPATGENGVIYLVPNGAGAPNQYTEWVWTGAAYEQLGDASVDLSGYASKKDLGIAAIDHTDSGPLIISDAMLATKSVYVSTLGVGTCTFSGSTDGSNVVTTTGSLSAGTLAGDDVVTTGGAVVTNYIKIVSDTPTLDYAAMMMGAEIVGYKFTDADGNKRNAIEIRADGVSLTNSFGANPYFDAPTLKTREIFGLERLFLASQCAIGSHICILSDAVNTGQTTLILGGYGKDDGVGIIYTHNPDLGKADILEIGRSSMLSLGSDGELRCGADVEGIRIYATGSDMATLSLRSRGEFRCGDYYEGISMYTSNGIATLRIGSQAEVIGLYDNKQADTFYVNTIYANDTDNEIAIEADVTNVASLGVHYDITARCFSVKNTAGSGDAIRLGMEDPTGTSMSALYLGEGVYITGPGWEEMQAAAAAVAAEAEQESFTKLIFPPAGTATAEQDPSWITKKNILMETNGGQLNMTHLTETLAYAAQNRFDIAKRTLWLSTSPGTGDAVQWPANAVFPDDQPQDKIQQLNSNSTYWFDITYVGGQDSILIRKVCSWASTTGENGPTD